MTDTEQRPPRTILHPARIHPLPLTPSLHSPRRCITHNPNHLNHICEPRKPRPKARDPPAPPSPPYPHYCLALLDPHGARHPVFSAKRRPNGRTKPGSPGKACRIRGQHMALGPGCGAGAAEGAHLGRGEGFEAVYDFAEYGGDVGSGEGEERGV